MPTAKQLKALIQSHAARDEARFYSVALQVAAQAARQGHNKLALELRQLVDDARSKSVALQPSSTRPRPTPLAQPRGELAGLLAVAYPSVRLSDLILDAAAGASIERVLVEQRQRDRLATHGLHPQRKLLLLGPPGTGKTMTAGVLAGELGLPLFTIQLDGLITKFLGETAAKLRLIFDAVAQTRAVYFFDEFDALGGERAGRNDVGEIRRVLNSFLQFLEQDDSPSLLVAATNHPGLLDRALFRRFDSVIEFQLPGPELAMEVMRSRLTVFDTAAVKWIECAQQASGLSHAEIARAAEQAAKDAILDHRRSLTTTDLATALRDRRRAHE